MFKDMHAMLSVQGDLINNIEYNVERSNEYVDKGIENMQDARKYQEKSRGVMCCIIAIVIAVVIFLIIVLSLSLGLGLRSSFVPQF
jgi:t-SNARE complex subunit (syntaxin)